MKIDFKKIAKTPKSVEVSYSSEDLECLEEGEILTFKGDLVRKDSKLIAFKGRLEGKMNLVCAKSGEEFVKDLGQDLALYFSDGIWEMQSQKNDFSLDVIEFFDGFIDFDSIAISEAESIRLDYNIKD